jgi:hypothetical protein
MGMSREVFLTRLEGLDERVAIPIRDRQSRTFREILESKEYLRL